MMRSLLSLSLQNEGFRAQMKGEKNAPNKIRGRLDLPEDARDEQGAVVGKSRDSFQILLKE